MNDDDKKTIMKKIDFFMDNKIKVHVKLTDYTWLNGFVSKKLRDDVYLFTEDKLGDIYLFTDSVYDIGGKR